MTSCTPSENSASGVLRVANCSGFYGDRLAAAREMVEGGPIDVLTGDYLAELTLILLAHARRRDDDLGYAKTFLQQLEEVAATCRDRDIKIVVNAGGVNPGALAARSRDLYRRLGLHATVAHVEGDDLLGRLDELGPLTNLDTGETLEKAGITPLHANAYLGSAPIIRALERGADLVICPRVTDAALVVGPAAWHFGWAPDDWDRLAGAVVAGHVIECGPQCTGGNYAFFNEVPGLDHPGFPIAEVAVDGTAVITKHSGTGGRVTRETVTAQLLYEIQGARYTTPDVVARFDTIELEDIGVDRVRISGVVGEAPTGLTKVSISYDAGWRNSMTFVLDGLACDAKERLVRDTLADLCESVQEHRITRDGRHLTIAVRDHERDKVGKRFAARAVEIALASYPGLHLTTPPHNPSFAAAHWPALIPTRLVRPSVVIDGIAEHLPTPSADVQVSPPSEAPLAAARRPGAAVRDEPQVGQLAPLGHIAGARSGDKGADANIGVWVRRPEDYDWLRATLTEERIAALLPEIDGCAVDIFQFLNLSAVNIVIRGLLGQGPGCSLLADPQAKGLAERLRAQPVPVPHPPPSSQMRS